MTFSVLSARDFKRSPAMSCVVEFENVVSEIFDAPIINAQAQGTPAPKSNTTSDIAFMVGISLFDVVQILNRFDRWRDRFGLVIAYVFDAFNYTTATKPPIWRQLISPSFRTISRIDHLFVPIKDSIMPISNTYGIPVSYLPMACDVLKFGSARADRHIDVMGYGRQHPEHSKFLSDYFNFERSNGIYYHTDHIHAQHVHDFARHRALFWNLLQRSKIALAYDAHLVNPTKKEFSVSFVGQRWFECLASGCLVAGRRPTCSEADELLNWEDSTVELPEDNQAMLELILELLNDDARLENTRIRNFQNSARKHDWRHRIQSFSSLLELPMTDRLKNELDELKNRADNCERRGG